MSADPRRDHLPPVTVGVERAVELARDAAVDPDVGLGGGVRLFDDIPPSVKLEQTRVVEAPGVAHLIYRFAY